MTSTRLSPLMTTAQEFAARGEAAAWRLPAGTALRLAAGPGARCLRVAAGRVWITAAGDGRTPPEDRVLGPGDTLALAHGSEWVLEAWGDDARFQLLVPPDACRARAAAGLRRLGAALRALGRRGPAMRWEAGGA
ncbi:DUF2917 domain-containing protein [Piscinibacter sakaiensis]|uniref:DUF2917 domain-containing protein n=1 Tax=Piscinibacter sakaiensis TaxID=1547922 RepID=A0A0K8P4J5_PISS1|nr:DUF2917 domain-containing protein [Piscinibacter sakaiensis]GAP37593.1 hypothetical protein ISF6_3538 [Piscinibacter sakaiensis]